MSSSGDKQSQGISKNLKILKNVSVLKSREKIAKKLKNPTDLQDISIMRAQIERELKAVESQLNTVVESKLDAIKRSVDLMDEAAVKLANYSKVMSKVGEKLAHTNTDLTKYPYLKRADNIRINLDKVINQIEYFASVPDKASMLRSKLRTDPSKLKEVVIESISQDSLRVEVVKKISDDEIELRDAIEQFLGSVPELAMEILNHILRFFGKKIKKPKKKSTSLDRLSDDDFDDINIDNNNRDFIDYAINDPSELVAYYEIVEMQQDYYERRIKHTTDTSDTMDTDISSDIRGIKSKKSPIKMNGSEAALSSSGSGGGNGGGGGGSKTFISDFEIYNIRPQVKQAMIDILEKRIIECFESYLNIAIEANDSQVTAVTDAGSELIKLLVDIINDVDPCVPPHYDLVLTYFYLFEKHLSPRIEEICITLTTLKVTDIFNLIDWIKYFNEQMERFHLQDQPCCHRYMAIADDVLLMEYLSRFKQQIIQFFENIENQDIEIVVSAEGRQMTTIPEDMFNVTYIQLGVARDGLPPIRFKDAITSCFQVLSEVQRRSHDNLLKHWMDYDPIRLCAIINDNRRMQEKSVELAATMISSVPNTEKDDSSRELLATQARVVADEYFTLASKATTYLARWIVLQELGEPVLLKLFTSEWENKQQGYSNLGSVIIATCEDYFTDLKRWLSPLFFGKFIQYLVNQITSHYIMSIRRRYVSNITSGQSSDPSTGGGSSVSGSAAAGMSVHGHNMNGYQGLIQDPYRVAELLIADRDVLFQFFCKFDSEGNIAMQSQPTSPQLHQGGDEEDDDDGIDYRFSTVSTYTADNNHMPPGSGRASNYLGPYAELFSNELMCIQAVAQLMVANHISGVITEGIHMLYERYGLDGLRVVQCIILGNMTKGKQEKQDLLDTANQMYIQKMLNTNHKNASHISTNNMTAMSSPVGRATVRSTLMQNATYSKEFAMEYTYIGDSSMDLNSLLGVTNMNGNTGNHSAANSQHNNTSNNTNTTNRKTLFWS